jgi:hypothetical protein
MDSLYLRVRPDVSDDLEDMLEKANVPFRSARIKGASGYDLFQIVVQISSVLAGPVTSVILSFIAKHHTIIVVEKGQAKEIKDAEQAKTIIQEHIKKIE